jgi:hypothetical protein
LKHSTKNKYHAPRLGFMPGRFIYARIDQKRGPDQRQRLQERAAPDMPILYNATGGRWRRFFVFRVNIP